jgi:hypothetical protein
MAKDPGERYPTAGELARASAAALEVTIPQSAGPPPPLAPLPRPPLEPDAPTVTSD